MITCLSDSEPLFLAHCSTTFGGFRYCDSEDKTFLNCHVISKDHVFRNLMGKNPS